MKGRQGPKGDRREQIRYAGCGVRIPIRRTIDLYWNSHPTGCPCRRFGRFCGLRLKRLDAGDDAQLAAAALAGLDFDGEHALEPLRPGQGLVAGR